MEINIQSVHFTASQQLEAFIQKKVSKLDQYFDGILSADVSLKVVKPEAAHNKEAQIRLVVPGHDLFAAKITDSFEKSIDESVQALEKQLAKFKEKIRGK